MRPPLNIPVSTNPLITSLFKPVEQRTTFNPIVGKGSLITFQYRYWKNDPFPLVIVTDMTAGQRLRGVNLHYLTFNYIQNMLSRFCENTGFSYANIRGDNYITGAFRSYRWAGIQQVKKLDCSFLNSVISTVRSFDPTQIRAIRDSVQQQIQQQVNPVPNIEQT